MMKKLLLIVLAVGLSSSLWAQKTTSEKKETKTTKKIDLSNRAADHFMIQYGKDNWSGTPDSIRTLGKSRHFNFYLMLDKPFQNNPNFSVAYGVGLSSSNIFFDKNYVDIKANSSRLPFRRSYAGNDSSSFSKFKLTTIFLEAPIELRYYSNPENPAKSWKGAIGVKIGTLLKSFTKGKDLQNKNGGSIYGNKFIEKQSEKRFFNGTRLAASARVGYGVFGLQFSYQITQVFKEGFGPEVRPYSIGLTLSGL
ncbi:MAG: PorT family protein [Chitinophagaceae bacterium]|nr:PorT family protein [Chitinophagaceae bacterium]